MVLMSVKGMFGALPMIDSDVVKASSTACDELSGRSLGAFWVVDSASNFVDRFG
jgi:hypothetical protein